MLAARQPPQPHISGLQLSAILFWYGRCFHWLHLSFSTHFTLIKNLVQCFVSWPNFSNVGLFLLPSCSCHCHFCCRCCHHHHCCCCCRCCCPCRHCHHHCHGHRWWHFAMNDLFYVLGIFQLLQPQPFKLSPSSWVLNKKPYEGEFFHPLPSHMSTTRHFISRCIPKHFCCLSLTPPLSLSHTHTLTCTQ